MVAGSSGVGDHELITTYLTSVGFSAAPFSSIGFGKKSISFIEPMFKV